MMDVIKTPEFDNQNNENEDLIAEMLRKRKDDVMEKDCPIVFGGKIVMCIPICFFSFFRLK